MNEKQADRNRVVMCGVTEYAEEMNVEIRITEGLFGSNIGQGREVIRAYNEAGCNSTEVDLEQALKWIATNKPDVYIKYVTSEMLSTYA